MYSVTFNFGMGVTVLQEVASASPKAKAESARVMAAAVKDFISACCRLFLSLLELILL